MRKSGKVGNDFVASAYRKEHWRARAETSICPTGVRVRHCLWATVYIRKSQGRVGRWLAYSPHRNQEQGSVYSEEGDHVQGGLYGRTGSYGITRIIGDIGGLARVVSHGQVGMKVVMTVYQLCLSPLDPPSPPTGSAHTLSGLPSWWD